jgi:hypothetical protein
MPRRLITTTKTFIYSDRRNAKGAKVSESSWIDPAFSNMFGFGGAKA